MTHEGSPDNYRYFEAQKTFGCLSDVERMWPDASIRSSACLHRSRFVGISPDLGLFFGRARDDVFRNHSPLPQLSQISIHIREEGRLVYFPRNHDELSFLC